VPYRKPQEASLQHHKESKSKVNNNRNVNDSNWGPWPWPKRMGSIQSLMAGMQEQLHALCGLHSSNSAMAQQLKQKGQRHLELLMQLAEAEQR
jgi:hypothetical protein